MITFRHIVGKSTLMEGIAVPKDLEDWIHAPVAGEKREINLIYDDGQTKAILRRIANGRGNVQIKYENRAGLAFRNWLKEMFIATQAGTVGEYLKDGIQVEVEFGNARTYYQDYIKFLLAYNQEVAAVGVLIVPTEGFARTLCAVGRKKAEAKGRHSYSGMIHLEKVRRELDYLAFMLRMPLAIAGIGPQK